MNESDTDRKFYRRQGLPADRIRPTPKQISENIAVIPKRFLDANQGLFNPNSFDVVFLGSPLSRRRLDSEHRISLPLKGRITDGTTLGLSVEKGVLHISQVPEQ